MRRSKRILMLLAMLTLGGCSSTTFIYNRLDFFIPWYLGDYVNLSRPQKRNLDVLLQPFLEWHRREELPLYIEALDQMEQLLDAGVSADGVESIANEFIAAWERIEARGLEWMISIGEELSEKQMNDFMDNLQEKQVEYEEEYLPRTQAEFREEAYENLLDSLQDYMGRLDWGQRGILEEAAEELRRSDSAWLEERARWLQRMEALLQREPGWQQGLRDALAQREQTTSPEYTETYEHNSRVIYTAIARVLSTRTEKQDKRLRKKLNDFREDLESLIQQ